MICSRPHPSLCGSDSGLAHTCVAGAYYAICHPKLMSACHAAREAFLVAMKQSSPSNGDNDRSGHEAIVGYICGTLSAAGKLTHESMSRHDPEGDMLCIHSVRPASLAIQHSCRQSGQLNSALRCTPCAQLFFSAAASHVPHCVGMCRPYAAEERDCKEDAAGIQGHDSEYAAP